MSEMALHFQLPDSGALEALVAQISRAFDAFTLRLNSARAGRELRPHIEDLCRALDELSESMSGDRPDLTPSLSECSACNQGDCNLLPKVERLINRIDDDILALMKSLSLPAKMRRIDCGVADMLDAKFKATIEAGLAYDAWLREVRRQYLVANASMRTFKRFEKTFEELADR